MGVTPHWGPVAYENTLLRGCRLIDGVCITSLLKTLELKDHGYSELNTFAFFLAHV
jgi:hypothetical protein